MGGSEVVIHNVSKNLVERYDRECDIASFSCKSKMSQDGVDYLPCPLGINAVVKMANKYDKLFVYGDVFKLWEKIIENEESISSDIFLAPVGFNNTLNRSRLKKTFLDNKDKFKIILHSDSYQDFQFSDRYGLDYSVIPNGVDLDEFSNNNKSFRDSYNISEDNIILCVSNFFPGKGQYHLARVGDQLRNLRGEEDFVFVFIATDTGFSFEKKEEDKLKSEMQKRKINYKILKNIPREDTVSAFLDADAFAFPSQQEVAPLVILESMAAGLPWLCMPVGNTKDLYGGKLIPFTKQNRDGSLSYGDSSYDFFAKHIDSIIDNKYGIADQLSEEGQCSVENYYNWRVLSGRYEEVIFN